MGTRQLFFSLTLYYAAVTAIVLVLSVVIPGFEDFLPIGGAQSLLSASGEDPLDSIEIGAGRATDLTGSLLWLLLAVLGALATVLPVTWTYMACRKRTEYDQALVETMAVLPIVVTAIVVIVNNSLALAFSLAGIVGGVRFRNTLKSSGDALFILLAIGIGLGSGIGALEVALVMSIVFNYVLVVLWVIDYGGKKGTRRFLRADHGDDDEYKDDWEESDQRTS